MSAGMPAVLANGGRRLAAVARPAAAGGQCGRRVAFRSAPPWLQRDAGEHLAGHLRADIGPTQVGPATVDAFHGHDEVAAALLDERWGRVPAEVLAAELAGYDVAHEHLGCAVLLIAHALVLWPQVQLDERWSLS